MDIQKIAAPAWTRRPRTEPIGLVTIHATRGANTMDKQFAATVNWFTNPPKNGAPGLWWGPTADIVIGSKGEVGECGDWRTTHSTWSAGYGAGGWEWAVDEVGISIELAQPAGLDARGQYTGDPNASYEPYTRECIDALVEYLRPIVREFNIPLVHHTWWDQERSKPALRGFIGHDETENGRKTGKSDPGRLFPWDELLRRLGDQSDAPTPPAVDPTKVRMVPIGTPQTEVISEAPWVDWSDKPDERIVSTVQRVLTKQRMRIVVDP